MKFVALISGGKDSCFNSMECVRRGHELVCLANLYPATASAGEAVSEEADSFMYQSAGHRAIEAQAECFGKPLVRRQISGKAMNQSLQYLPTDEDEVEDLFLLLKDVKKQFPEVEAVGSGAILSNYQRTRVESVCERLGLTSLAYLWRRPQSTLLNDMIGAGIDAILVKVASFGLEPSKHLGKSLARLRPYFESLHERCGFHVCGEGGEYETLTLDCPLFVRRLVLDDTVVVKHSDDMFAPVGLLRVVECHSEPKQEEETLGEVGGATDGDDPPSPLDHNTNGAKDQTLDEGPQQQDSTRRAAADATNSEAPDALALMATPRTVFLPHVHEGSGGLVYLSGGRAPGLFAPVPAPVSASNGATFEAPINEGKASAVRQAARCISSARAALDAVGVSMRDICFVHLYLRDMAHFTAVNAEYCKWFEGINPPSRSCVAVPLPPGCWVELDVVALRGSGAALLREGSACELRQVLHVRSISNWAPVCIGPYCQANTLAPGNTIALIAGQIGLQPASMTLPPRPSHPFASAASAAGTRIMPRPTAVGEEGLGPGRSFHDAELRLCVSHASAVASAVGASLSRGCLFATLYVSEEAARAAAGATQVEAAGKPPSPGAMEEPSGCNGTTRADRNCGGGQGYGNGKKEWLRGMVEECRRLMEARFGQEEAEARAERAGTSGGKGGDGDDDSAEEGWTSDPEELAKEAARKRVLSRRVPVLPVMVTALPKNSAVELEVICMSRAALSLLPCKHYPPSTRREILAKPKRNPFPVPEKFAAPPLGASKDGNGGEAGTLVATATTTGSTVDRILCVVESSLSVAIPAEHLPEGVAREAGVTIPSTSANCNRSANDNGVTFDERGEAIGGETILNPLVSGLAITGAWLERALTLALEGISEAVSSARLRWRDVSHLRVYYQHHRVTTSRVVSASAAAPPASGSLGGLAIDSGEAPGAVSRAVTAAGWVEYYGAGHGDDDERYEELLKRAMHLALAAATPERPAMTFVPVTGLTVVEDIIVSVHATALSLDRLRTELWVRGVP